MACDKESSCINYPDLCNNCIDQDKYLTGRDLENEKRNNTSDRK